MPDFYQGTEFWDLSLVDPDNRRKVDYTARRGILWSERSSWPELCADWQSGVVKLTLMRDLLRIRHRWPDLFHNGTYEPLETTGPHANHVIAFARVWKKSRLVVVVGRHYAPLTDGGRCWPSKWDAALRLPAGKYQEILGLPSSDHKSEIGIATLFRAIPVSVMRQL